LRSVLFKNDALINYFFMKEEIKAYNNVLELIGNTPLIKLNRVTENLEGNFYAKVEAFNPGHSTKDRIALFILEEAERKGILTPGDTIIETTSGNTGFSLAMVSIIKGIIASWQLAQNHQKIK
jgi:cystathionine beta-synthase